MLKNTCKGGEFHPPADSLARKLTVTNKRLTQRKKEDLIQDLIGVQLADIME